MPKKKPSIELRLSRVDFYRFRGPEFFETLFECIDGMLGDAHEHSKRWDKLNPHQQAVYGWWCFWGDVENGGLAQFFYNCGDAFVAPLEKFLKATDNAPMVALLKRATKIYRKHKKEFQTEKTWGDDGLFARMTELEKLDQPIIRLIDGVAKKGEKWLRENISLIAIGDSGEPIDPNFTGEIESHHVNGNVFEQATVRRGKLIGAYRRFVDDGTLEGTCFYSAGEISSNYWPNGQPKHKTIKQGMLRIDEWYYPSGAIQKRFVGDKQGNAVETVRVWHENGQLAQEIHMKANEQVGPWLKFFEDGSPRLQAEFRSKDELVVKNAWDEKRRQVVKNGSGTFFRDGIHFDCYYALSWESGWTRRSELRKGVRHGTELRWHDGVLWSKQEFSNGKLNGESISFYDNGRVRTKTIYRNEKEIKKEDFPKFDNPRPAVVMSVEANTKLYEAWKQPLLETYPAPRNLEEIRARLPIPKFLQEVLERNLSNSIREEFENLNTFNDGSAYHVTVDEKGDVQKVQWTGSSVYSGASVNVYPPFIQKLKFQPGRSQGRPVRCRVLIRVNHTFAEASEKN